MDVPFQLVRLVCLLFGSSEFWPPNRLKNFLKKACPTSRFPAYLASVRRPLAIISLLAISTAGAYAQALAPSTLHLTSPEQETKKDIVQVITKEKSPEQETTEQETKKDIAKAVTKKPTQLITKKPAQTIAPEPARALTIEPVRPIDKLVEKQTRPSTKWPFSRFSYKTPEGKKESVPVISQYYPKQIVYPLAKVNRHIDRKLMQAATIAQERAHAHSRSRCWHYVKDALLASGVIDSRPKTALARDAAQELVSNYGFKRLSVNDPFSAPVGSVLVYGTSRTVGHVEIRTRDGFVSDFRSKTPSPRPLLGVYAKL
jgi:hypothetical protein